MHQIPNRKRIQLLSLKVPKKKKFSSSYFWKALNNNDLKMISPWKNCKDRQKFLKESINHKKFDYDNETNLENDQEDWKNSTPTKCRKSLQFGN